MVDKSSLNHPWLVAAWPGMGNVALNAGIYLMAKLDMQLYTEFNGNDFFDVPQVEVRDGIVQPGRRPRNRFYLWQDPQKVRDILVLLGEGQPSTGIYSFCEQILAYARELGVERVLTFAAMATQMHPQQPSKVFGAATDETRLAELKRLSLKILEDGHIGGLNGVLLGAAADCGLSGACLLGEIPHLLSRLPFPKASRAILQTFTALTDIKIDLTELSLQVDAMERRLGEILNQVEQAYGSRFASEADEYRPETAEEEQISTADRILIENLFEQAASNRSKAFELKQELDRLGVFKEYEDRFLDLFKKPE